MYRDCGGKTGNPGANHDDVVAHSLTLWVDPTAVKGLGL
ncbi:hypothetical protein MMASJCM_1625 [Mycobacteroides abscessus subsp. massiliense CCUG 48898 = JCM 15300]|nr:hypothetical protein MMASJCM_1625 [Mycobacteroides abscessus subsp. massiliense CCUG 48898 = JCM 15300]